MGWQLLLNCTSTTLKTVDPFLQNPLLRKSLWYNDVGIFYGINDDVRDSLFDGFWDRSKEGVIAGVVDDMLKGNTVGKIEDNSNKRVEQYV